MPLATRVPPGRAGRLWLSRRLEVARQASSLLDRKRRILRREHERLVLVADHSRKEWERRLRDAERWLLRGALLGGQRAVLGGSRDRDGMARVRLDWRNMAGVTYPVDFDAQMPDTPPLPVGANPALANAAESYRRALQAGINHAVATTALRLVEKELAATSQRLRSVEDRWIPQLESALARLDLRLAELEREEILRLRWAHAQRCGPTGPR